MYPLLLLSVISWGIFVERLVVLSFFRRKRKQLTDKVRTHLADNKVESAASSCEDFSEMVAEPYKGLFEHNEENVTREEHEGSVGRRINKTILGLKKRLWILATVATIAPFLGLLGTVTGIMNSFAAIADSGKSGFSVVSSGLSEALLTTAVGIVIAVVTVIFFNFLQNKINFIVCNMKEDLEHLISARLNNRR